MNMKYFNYNKLRNIGLCLLSLLSVQVSAQKDIPGNTNKISGIVIDAATGKPLVGVRIQAYNDPYYAAMTKEDGSYTINVSDYVSSLSFALDGYNISVCPLSNGKSSLNTSLYSDKFSSEYSNSTIASKTRVIQVESQNSDISIDPQMQQKMMGDIYSTSRSGQIGVGNTLLIDGINTLNINARPLIVLDGVLMDMGYDNETMHDGFFNNILSNIMVDDIEKVTVLKNGLAIYGAKGANGVILIDTKRNKSMATKIDLSISGNYQTLPKLPEVMNASQYRSYISELLGTTGTKLTNIKFLQTDPSYPYYNTYNNDTKWSDVVYDQAFIQNYSVNVQGGDEVANYNLSVGYAFGDATIVDNDYSRFNIRLNSDIVLSDNMDLRFDASYSDVNRDLRDDGATDNIDNSMITSPGFLSLIKSPFLSPYAYDVYGNISSYLASGDDYLDEVLEDGYSLSNPLALLENGEAINKNSFGNRLITIAISP
jgi:TonB-dependent SusC/RagA subfamily outer membrane receptor